MQGIEVLEMHICLLESLNAKLGVLAAARVPFFELFFSPVGTQQDKCSYAPAPFEI